MIPLLCAIALLVIVVGTSLRETWLADHPRCSECGRRVKRNGVFIVTRESESGTTVTRSIVCCECMDATYRSAMK